MICPGCGWNMPDDVQFCSNCGSKISAQTQTAPSLQQQSKKPKMVFNIVFAAWMMFSYTGGAAGGLGIFASESWAEVVAYLLMIAFSAFIVFTGISLIKREKFGFVSQYFINSIGTLLCGAACVGSILAICLFDGSAGEYDQIFNVLWDLIFWVILIGSLPGLGMHTAGLIYYTKNRKKYFASGETRTINGDVEYVLSN